ncbi:MULTISPECIES: M35 family metallo-endopeptidase [Burkholderia]|uniref:Peptidase M35 n=1 Tax=Burkholderia aenigmatica TaxID=2015348 RepID=A0ABY6Y627_9BURK|nr:MULTISPECIES: M35 family metallo-endopeptidase [Burkholderia]VWD30309.1 peptidase M35 [Burkholderia aenigmatica]VWD56897.1 peptidase M35 [Burkholderia aenigmatica]
MRNDNTESPYDDGWEPIGTVSTNTTAGSVRDIELDLTPICQNMSNKTFRASIARLRDMAIPLIQDRVAGLGRWDEAEQLRVRKWFGRSDKMTRDTLRVGMPKLLDVMQSLKPENVIRWDRQKQRNITCTVFPDNGHTDAAVCKPDSEKRIIAIYSHFCTSPPAQRWRGCQLLTLIHECTHFTDVFDSTDEMYGVSIGLSFWAQSNPDNAIRNADSLACYVGFDE